MFDPGLLLVEGYEVADTGLYYNPDSYKVIFDMLVTRVDVNARDQAGLTPLIACVRQNDYDLARALIELGASPFLRFENKTPLDMALDNPDTDPRLVELLREAMR